MVDDDITNCFVVLGGGIVVGLISFDKIGLEDDRRQVTIGCLKNYGLSLRDKMSRFAAGFTAIFKVLAQPTLEIDRFTNVQGPAGAVGEDIDSG